MKHYPVDPEQLCALMEEVFAQGGAFRFYPTGVSMLPMLRERRDSVLLCAPSHHPVRKYDVILYKRADGQVVLHRVIGKDKQGMLILCGDHQVIPERGICTEQVLGVLSEFYKGSCIIRTTNPFYRVYAVFWTAIRPFRSLLARLFRRTRISKANEK